MGSDEDDNDLGEFGDIVADTMKAPEVEVSVATPGPRLDSDDETTDLSSTPATVGGTPGGKSELSDTQVFLFDKEEMEGRCLGLIGVNGFKFCSKSKTDCNVKGHARKADVRVDCFYIKSPPAS